MCLISKKAVWKESAADSLIKTAAKDITVYKLVKYDKKTDDYHGVLYSRLGPFYTTVKTNDRKLLGQYEVQRSERDEPKIYGPNKLGTSVIECDGFIGSSWGAPFTWGKFRLEVTRGFHSYRKLRIPVAIKEQADFIGGDDFRILRCIIPKGARYIVGFKDEVVSDHLQVLGDMDGNDGFPWPTEPSRIRHCKSVA